MFLHPALFHRCPLGLHSRVHLPRQETDALLHAAILSAEPRLRVPLSVHRDRLLGGSAYSETLLLREYAKDLAEDEQDDPLPDRLRPYPLPLLDISKRKQSCQKGNWWDGHRRGVFSVHIPLLPGYRTYHPLRICSVVR